MESTTAYRQLGCKGPFCSTLLDGEGRISDRADKTYF